MRTLVTVLLTLACLLAATPDAQANKYKPEGGKYKMKVGEKLKVTTTGFGGCKFETIWDETV
jgi:protein involved in polysaccharide export with SLBB domain